MDINGLVTKITNDVAVDLNEEYKRNFERKAFFDQAWPISKFKNAKGSAMMRSGALRRSIKYNVVAGMITWSSSLPYAKINNEGGEITVTVQMKKFFWAMYYKAAGAITTKKDGAASKSKKNERLTGEAAQWKALALKKVGSKIKISKRQFIGSHPQVTAIIKKHTDNHLHIIDSYIKNSLRR